MSFQDEDGSTTVPRLPELLGRTYVLVVVGGADRGKRMVVDPSSPGVLVGSSRTCELCLTDPQVSRRHAALGIDRGRLRMTDLESTNGTFVNGARIADVWLTGGEQIRLGETLLSVEVTATDAGRDLPKVDRFGATVGASDAMRRIYPLCERLAGSNVSVVIEGETGTGKEVLAESIHDAGPRKSGPFIVFDCTAVAPNLVESALFGHEKGAFTSAIGVHRGVFEQADGGTLLIDEIGDLDLALQSKLLRVLSRGQVQRIGSEKSIAVDVRILAATRRDLDKEVLAGRFRDDLFFRLAVARVELPPLRMRHGDVTLLARHFWRMLGGDAAGIDHAVLARFESYAWPGNVRELHNAVSRLVALGAIGELERPDARATALAAAAHGDLIDRVVAMELPLAAARDRVVSAFEQRYIQHMLAKYGGNVTRAAEASGIARRYFRLIKSRGAKEDPDP